MSLDAALARAASGGADECEAVYSKRRVLTVRIAGSAISEVLQSSGESCCARVVSGDRVATARSGPGGLADAVSRALGRAGGLRRLEFWPGLPPDSPRAGIGGAYDARLAGMSEAGAADMAEAMIAGAPEADVTGSLHIVSEEYAVANSNGLRYDDSATYVSGTINADSGGSSGIGHSCGRTMAGFSPGRAGREAGAMCGASGHARIEPGEYSVILEPYAAGELLALVAAPAFALKAYSEGRSCLSDMAREEVAGGGLTISDDPHAPEGMGSKGADDEGVPTRPRDLVGDGIMLGTISDTHDAAREHAESTGNASRPCAPLGRGAEPVPACAPHNLTVRPGDMGLDEMVGETRRGILVGRLWYTYAVNPIKGDFSCTARSGVMLIENGRTRPAGQARIMDSLPRALAAISGIGKEQRRVAQWASLPTTVPAIRIEGVRAEPV